MRWFKTKDRTVYLWFQVEYESPSQTSFRCDSKLTPKCTMIILIPICVFVSIPLMAQSGSIPISSGWDRSRCDDLPVKNQRQKPRAWWRCFKSPSPSNSESCQERLEKGLEITPRLLQGSRNRSYHVWERPGCGVPSDCSLPSISPSLGQAFRPQSFQKRRSRHLRCHRGDSVLWEVA